MSIFSVLQYALDVRCPWKSESQFKQYLGSQCIGESMRYGRIEDGLPDDVKLVVINENYKTLYENQEKRRLVQEVRMMKTNCGHKHVPTVVGLYPKQYEERPIMIYDHSIMTGYDGSKEHQYTMDQFKKTKGKYKFVLVRRDWNTRKGIEKSPSFQESYNAFKAMADELKEKKIINMYQHGGVLTNASLRVFERTCRLYYPEQITAEESQWLEEASVGAIIWADKYEGKAYKYDYNSHYPSIMGLSTFWIPLRQGQFDKITVEHFNKVGSLLNGIYKCQVFPSNTKKDRLFRFNPNNKYTSDDIMFARSLGLKCDLIDDDINVLYYYKKDCVNGKQLFGEFVTELYKHKKHQVKGAKMLLTSLWGALTQIDVTTMKVSVDSEEMLEIGSNKTIMSIIPIDENTRQVTFANSNRIYRHRFARMKPFLLSHGRIKIAKCLEKQLDDVVRVHTDGFITSNPLKHKINPTKIGCLKYEGYHPDCKIQNVNKYTKDGWIL